MLTPPDKQVPPPTPPNANPAPPALNPGGGQTTHVTTTTPPKNTPIVPKPNVTVIKSGYTIGQNIYAAAPDGANIYSTTSPGVNTLLQHYKPYYFIGTFLRMENNMVKMAAEDVGPFLSYKEVYAMPSAVFSTK